jgi:large subunit ribosomal protein L24
MPKLKIKKNDKVIVLAGKDKGKTGDVLEVLPKDNRVIVSGVNIVTKHAKPTNRDAGGIKRYEASVHISNVAHVDPKSGKATRVGMKKLASGEKALIARKSGEEIRRV